MAADYEDIDRYADEYTPEKSGYMPGPEALNDGVYDFVVTGGSLSKTTKQQKSVFNLALRITSGPLNGFEVQRATFFDRPEDLRFLGGDLVTLGIDAANWGRNGKSWSQELIDACPKLVGIHFRGAKSTAKGTKQDFHRIHVNARINGPGSAPPGAVKTFDEFAPPPPAAKPLAAAVPSSNDEILW